MPCGVCVSVQIFPRFNEAKEIEKVDVYTQIELQRLAVKQPYYCTYETNDTPGLTIAVCSSEVSKKDCLAAPGEEATIIATKAPLNSPPLGEELGLWTRVGKVSHSLGLGNGVTSTQ